MLWVEKKSSTDWKSLSLHNWPDCFCAWEFWQQSHKKWMSPPYHGFTARPLRKLCVHFQSCQLRRRKKPLPLPRLYRNSDALFLIKFSSCWCCSPLSKDQLTLPTAHQGNKSTWLTETLTFTPRPQHLQNHWRIKILIWKWIITVINATFAVAKTKQRSRVRIPYKPEFFFQAFFSQLQKYNSVYNCDDLLSYNSAPRSSHIWFSYIRVQ